MNETDRKDCFLKKTLSLYQVTFLRSKFLAQYLLRFNHFFWVSFLFFFLPFLHVTRLVAERVLAVRGEINRPSVREVVVVERRLHQLVDIFIGHKHKIRRKTRIEHLLQITLRDLAVTIGIVDLEEQPLLLGLRDVTCLVLINCQTGDELDEVNATAVVAIKHAEEPVDEDGAPVAGHHVPELLGVNHIIVLHGSAKLLEVDEHVRDFFGGEGGRFGQLRYCCCVRHFFFWLLSKKKKGVIEKELIE